MEKKTIFIFIIAVFFSGAMVGSDAQVSGNITYTLNRESNPAQDQSDAYKKIASAMDSAIWYNLLYLQFWTCRDELNTPGL